MGKPIVREFGQSKGILKFFPHQAAACVVPESMVSSADEYGRKIVPAGTPFPANDATCLGYLLEDVDVTRGDAPGTYVYEGVLDPDKLPVDPAEAALKATPRVTVFGRVYGATS